mgnify:CR=1 FL=1
MFGPWLLIALALVTMLLPPRGAGDAAVAARSPLRIGLVFDVGGRGDKSFNDAAWAGLERARRELGVTVEYVEPADGDWFANGWDFDFRKPTADYDLQGLAKYAASKGVHLIGHHETGCAASHYERQMDAALRWAAPRTKSSSGSMSLHRAWATHSWRPSPMIVSSEPRGLLVPGRTPASSVREVPGRVAVIEVPLSEWSRPRSCRVAPPAF